MPETSSTSSQWPSALDAVIAAPEHHRLLLENDSVRVLDTWIGPGDIVKLHTHRWPATYYILSAGDFVRRDETGQVTLDTRQLADKPRAGQAIWSGPLALHTLENVGPTPIHVISVEIKSSEHSSPKTP